jgi:hypothetical protein
MTFEAYTGDAYWDYPAIERWCRSYADAHPGWVELQSIGKSAEGRDILLLALGRNPGTTPAFWLDGGTHAAEWTGVMATLYALSKWAAEFSTAEGKWFHGNTIYVVPCVSPDGYQALHEGAPFIRSSTRLPRPGVRRVGLDPQDIDGDGKVRLMRWRDAAGPFIVDDSHPLGVRRRSIRDDPSKACFLCQEGLFLQWDGFKWIQAPLKHGLDLNRNFPVYWLPFQMFGMDGGAYALSEPESRALMDAVAQRPCISAGLTNHTYTGAILTQPYHPDPAIPESDVNLMERLAEEAVVGTDYRVMRVHPDFTYDPKKRIIGVWADCLTTTMGIPAYTLELWNPFGWAGVEVEKPAEFFRKPDPAVVDAVLAKAAEEGSFSYWTPFRHPQLGDVELGGIDHLQTIRNPPPALLPEECEKGFKVADAIRRSLPQLNVEVEIERLGIELYRVEALVENTGFLSSTALARARDIGAASGVRLWLEIPEGVELVEGSQEQDLGRLEGWGDWQVSSAQNPIYPGLPASGHRGKGTWVLRGAGELLLFWSGGRAGSGNRPLQLD